MASIPEVNAKPVEVAQGSADDLGVMSINLKDVVKPQVGVQGQTQAAGTPNEAGLGGFMPLVVGENSVFFADVLANANFADWGNSSSGVIFAGSHRSRSEMPLGLKGAETIGGDQRQQEQEQANITRANSTTVCV